MIFSVIDVETTGGNPKSSKITEIAIFRHDGHQVIDKFVSLVNPEMPIPEFVSNLTGISDGMVQNSPKFYEIAKDIVEFTKDTVFVAHNVSFDYGMIRSEYRRLGYDYRLPHICTVQTSRKLLPNLESYSLGKLTKSLGIQLNGRHRAGGDALATAELLSLLIEKGDVGQFIQDEINVTALHPLLNMEEIEEIPNKPGIYKFFDENNQLIYLGKGKYIRTQIEQHLKNSSLKKSAAWGKNIARIEFELTGNELIAAILEHQLLKKGLPSYNKPEKKVTKAHLFNDAINELDFNEESFFLLRKGRTKFERSVLLVENGQFVGFGYAPFHFNHQTPIFWKKFIDYTSSDEVIQRIIAAFVKKENIEKIRF
ncbi:MAG: exonuclease domain-containing protein [Crocinitomicaceae bacterium]|nr:exonuclease domain-containing protein [Crocinitomicaceae bacterium]